MRPEDRNTLACVALVLSMCAGLSYIYNVSFEDYLIVLKDIVHGGVQ